MSPRKLFSWYFWKHQCKNWGKLHEYNRILSVYTKLLWKNIGIPPFDTSFFQNLPITKVNNYHPYNVTSYSKDTDPRTHSGNNPFGCLERSKGLLRTVQIEIRLHRTCSLILDLHYPEQRYYPPKYVYLWNRNISIFSIRCKSFILFRERTIYLTTKFWIQPNRK